MNKKAEFTFQRLIIILLSLALLLFALWFVKGRIDAGGFALDFFFNLFK